MMRTMPAAGSMNPRAMRQIQKIRVNFKKLIKFYCFIFFNMFSSRIITQIQISDFTDSDSQIKAQAQIDKT